MRVGEQDPGGAESTPKSLILSHDWVVKKFDFLGYEVCCKNLDKN